MSPIRILIADDHAMVREGLRVFIASEPGMQLIGEAANGIEAVEKFKMLKPDIILLDLVLPGLDGIDVIKAIKNDDPKARILVITSYPDGEKVLAAVKAGALGYMLKDTSPEQLFQAIRDVVLGIPSMQPGVTLTLIQELSGPSVPEHSSEPLTERELEVLKLVAQGMSNSEIAKRMVLSEWTVRTHVRNILGKLNLENRTKAALYAIRAGIIDK